MFRTHKLIATTTAALALAAPAAAVAQQDLRSPDSRDAAVGVRQDLRSPDAREAATVVRQDLRSADARDAAVRPTPVPAAPSPVRFDEPGGFQWGDAGIGAAGMLGLVLALGGIGVITMHHRRRPPFVTH